jgi:phospholipid/cholesterol/gamma-HCH transport system substrate-binding protein
VSLFTSTPRERRMAWRAGLFVALGLALAGIVVFFIGQETRLFEERRIFRAYFQNVQGLTEQSPVWLGGLKVGKVESISFTEGTAERGVEVRFRISARLADRVREDSVVRLSSLGVVGEKAVDVSLGSGRWSRTGASCARTRPET